MLRSYVPAISRIKGFQPDIVDIAKFIYQLFFKYYMKIPTARFCRLSEQTSSHEGNRVGVSGVIFVLVIVDFFVFYYIPICIFALAAFIFIPFYTFYVL